LNEILQYLSVLGLGMQQKSLLLAGLSRERHYPITGSRFDFPLTHQGTSVIYRLFCTSYLQSTSGIAQRLKFSRVYELKKLTSTWVTWINLQVDWSQTIDSTQPNSSDLGGFEWEIAATLLATSGFNVCGIRGDSNVLRIWHWHSHQHRQCSSERWGMLWVTNAVNVC
jgi:hypothetical protein